MNNSFPFGSLHSNTAIRSRLINNSQRPNRGYGHNGKKTFGPQNNLSIFPQNPARYDFPKLSRSGPGLLPSPGNKFPINHGKSNMPQGSERNKANFRTNRPYFSDPLILSRVSQYIQNTGRNVDIDFDHMVDELQKDYHEYRRKKRQAFKHHVRKAVEVITFENSLIEDEDEVIDDDEDGDDNEDRRSPSYAFEGDGDVNSALEDSYMQQNAKKSRKTSDSAAQELISIVTSDEDNTEDVEPNDADKAKSSESPERKDLEKNDTDDVIPEPMPAPKPAPAVTRKRRGEVQLPGSKKFKSSLEPIRPTTSFKDIGGNEKVLREVTQLLVHMRHPEVYRVLGVSPPRGFLLHGPPGSGKTLLAHAISGELKVPLLKVAAPELVGGLSGQSEERIRDLFEQAVALAPCLLFIDEVDAITPNRETAHREMERRIVAQLLSSMDELAGNENGDQVLVIGATNRPDSLDPALRRAGRFDREVCLGIPDRESRQSILTSLCRTLRLTSELKLEDVAAMTPGYVGADLKSLVTEAAMAAVNRLFKTLHESASETNLNSTPKESEENASKENPDKAVETSSSQPVTVEDEDLMIVDECINNDDKEVTICADENKKTPDEGPKESCETKEDQPSVAAQSDRGVRATQSEPSLLHSPPLSKEQLEGVYITMADFEVALKAVQPSAKREGFATVPDVKWEDIGSLQDIRHELQMAILAPVRYPKEFASMGLETATGVLLCGPPGCGKTLLAKAIANEAGINFISVKGPELLNMYVGESERAVRQCFQRARSSQPCVIFFDEIDALCPKRTNMENGASRVVNQLLTEMDGIEGRAGVFLMAATNRPDIVDPAVMRPGRLDKVLYVGLPAPGDRLDILQALTKRGKRPVLEEDVDLQTVASDSRCEGYTGADLAALVREASIHALKEYMGSEVKESVPELKLSGRHFTSALDKIRPSVSDKDKARYEVLRLQYTAVPGIG